LHAFGTFACFVGVLAITAGTLVQKRRGGTADFRTTGVIQYTTAALATGLASLAIESQTVVWNGKFLFALVWLSLVNSIASVALLFAMVRRNSVSQVSSLFYLTPSVTAGLAFLFFREPINLLMIAGIILSGLGVYLTVSPASPSTIVDTPE